jgi:presenilin-like A22 family membrane protease
MLKMTFTLISMLAAFVLGCAGTFIGLLVLDYFILHEHDGQAGIGYLVLAFWVGIACSIFAGRYFWRKY